MPVRPTRNLPGPRFRVIAIATLATITIGGTVVGLGAPSDQDDDAAVSMQPAAVTADDGAGDGFDGAVVTEVTTTLPTVPEATTAEVPDVADVSTDTSDAGAMLDGAADVSADADPIDPTPTAGAPMSGTPTLSDVPTLGADVCLPVTSAAETPGDPGVSGEGAPESAPGTSDTAAVESNDAAIVDGFENGSASWVPLSGSWTVTDGRYVQADATGYDFISQLNVDLPEQYAISVDLAPIDAPLGGGVLIGQPVVGSRRGATLVDFTDGGNFLRWGIYDAESGQYQYTGGVATGPDFDPTSIHTLRVEVRSGRTFVALDGRSVGDFAAVGPGRAGLATSLSAIAFDDVRIERL